MELGRCRACRFVGETLESQCMSSISNSSDRERWNQKYREAPESWMEPDSFLLRAFPEFIRPLSPVTGRALDLAGGAGRNAIWLAKQGWEVTLIDISEIGIEQARQKAGPFASHIHFVLDDLTGFRASQTQFGEGFDLVMAFFYLDRNIFPEIVKAIRPGGLLVYKTVTLEQMNLPGGPKDPARMLAPGELLHLAEGLKVLHYREQIAEKATAELVARKS